MPYTKAQIVAQAIKEYTAGGRTADIAAKHGMPRHLLARWMSAAGFVFGPPIRGPLKPIDTSIAKKMYEEQVSIKEIAKKFSISAHGAAKQMKNAGIKLRTRSENMKLRMAKISEADKALRANELKKIFTGRAKSRHALLKHARTRQENARQTVKESVFYYNFTSAGLNPIAQFAIDKYNIDFAFPDCRVAIEVDCPWSSWKERGEQARKRDLFLKRRGWVTIRLKGHAWKWQWLKPIVELVEARRKLRLL